MAIEASLRDLQRDGGKQEEIGLVEEEEEEEDDEEEEEEDKGKDNDENKDKAG